MPPRRSARVAEAAERATAVLSPLPHAVVLAIFARLPVDARLRCLEVCRAWRALLSGELSLWSTRLDVSTETGGLARPVTEALFRAAAARARGQLQALDVRYANLPDDAVVKVLGANGALRELRVGHQPWGVPRELLERLSRAAPQLRVLDAEAVCNSVDSAQRMLRREEPLTALRLHALMLYGHRLDAGQLRTLGRDFVAHPSCVSVHLEHMLLQPGALEVLVDTAVQCGWRILRLFFCECDATAAAAPALARLLSGNGALTELNIYNAAPMNRLPSAPESAALLAAALRAHTAMTSLTLGGVGLWRDPGVAAALLGAATGHRSLRTLDFCRNSLLAATAAQRAAAGALLAALVAADSPSLISLSVRSCRLGDEGLRPLFAALPHNHHLRSLNCISNDATHAFLAEIMPAVRANQSLRELVLDTIPPEAQAFVAARAAAARP